MYLLFKLNDCKQIIIEMLQDFHCKLRSSPLVQFRLSVTFHSIKIVIEFHVCAVCHRQREVYSRSEAVHQSYSWVATCGTQHTDTATLSILYFFCMTFNTMFFITTAIHYISIKCIEFSFFVIIFFCVAAHCFVELVHE